MGCLRWEFGFTCAFCLLHEADLAKRGAARTGLFAIEHFIPQSHDETLVDSYENCFYICRYCNGTRSRRPNTSADGRRLLNPVDSRWSEHFEARDGRLEALTPDARYTQWAYGLNDDRKVVFREDRARMVTRSLRFLQTVGPRLAAIAMKLRSAAGQRRDELKELSDSLLEQRRRALEELSTYLAVPADRPTACQCWSQQRKKLPEVLSCQTVEVDA